MRFPWRLLGFILYHLCREEIVKIFSRFSLTRFSLGLGINFGKLRQALRLWKSAASGAVH
jgi:hypothetical protein